jgi:hypothetical protein
VVTTTRLNPKASEGNAQGPGRAVVLSAKLRVMQVHFQAAKSAKPATAKLPRYTSGPCSGYLQ